MNPDKYELKLLLEICQAAEEEIFDQADNDNMSKLLYINNILRQIENDLFFHHPF